MLHQEFAQLFLAGELRVARRLAADSTAGVSISRPAHSPPASNASEASCGSPPAAGSVVGAAHHLRRRACPALHREAAHHTGLLLDGPFQAML